MRAQMGEHRGDYADDAFSDADNARDDARTVQHMWQHTAELTAAVYRRVVQLDSESCLTKNQSLAAIFEMTFN